MKKLLVTISRVMTVPAKVDRRGVGGANASANLYSLIETCKANGIDPYHYLAALFKALPHAKSADDFEALLPWRLASPIPA